MKGSLWERPIKRINFHGHNYPLRPAFRRVLQCYTVLNDPLLPEMDKLELCMKLLIRQYRIRTWRLPARQRMELFETVFRELVDTGGKKPSSGNKPFDFDQDAGYIYAAFAQCYGMDLLGRDKNLHWWKFIHLFGGLPEDTRIMEIVSIRQRPMPKPTKHNAEERQNLLRLKAYYRLEESPEARRERMEKGWQKIAAVLKGMAHGSNPEN